MSLIQVSGPIEKLHVDMTTYNIYLNDVLDLIYYLGITNTHHRYYTRFLVYNTSKKI